MLYKVSVCREHGFNVSEFMRVDWVYWRESKDTGVRNVKLCVPVEEVTLLSILLRPDDLEQTLTKPLSVTS